MSDHIQITCPHCGYSKQVDRERIPAHVTSVNCPTCQASFPFVEPTKIGAPPVQKSPPSFTEPRHVPFVFTGRAREYFGIWIVNTLLKVLTLGLYSPWAKVRKRQYFYGNTLLDDANFDYLANPIALLKGWLIGAALFIAYTLGSKYNPLIGMGFGLIFFFLVPWVVVRSRLFNNRNSAHRNVRFNFRPAYAEAYTAYAWLPLLTVFTAGLLAPYVYYRQKKFLMENNSFGQSFFTFEAGVWDFYLISLKAAGFALLLFGGMMVGSAVLVPGINPDQSTLPVLFGVAMPVLFMCGYFFLLIYTYVRTSNLTWNSTNIGKNHFVSTMRVRDMTWILFSNLVAALVSVGLLIPWGSIRLARYRFAHLAILARDDLDRFRAKELEATSAAGEEIGDVFGLDIGF